MYRFGLVNHYSMRIIVAQIILVFIKYVLKYLQKRGGCMIEPSDFDVLPISYKT